LWGLDVEGVRKGFATAREVRDLREEDEGVEELAEEEAKPEPKPPKPLNGEILTGPYKGMTLKRGRILGPKPEPALAPEMPQAEGPLRETEAALKASASTAGAAAEDPVGKWIMGLSPQNREQVASALGIKHASPYGVEFHERGKALTTQNGARAFQHSKMPAGIPASLENALIAIDKLAIDCKYDVFHDRIVVAEHQIGLRGDVANNLENVTLKVRQAVLQRFGFDCGSQFTFDALKVICLDRIFDPVLDYLDGLQWDGVPRLDRWLIDYCGADETELNRAIGRKMLVAAVRRVRCPGCKFDYIVVLESEKQGIGKSTMLKTLAGAENFSDAEIIGLDKKEQQESVQGIWIYEIGELEGMHKSDVTRIKLFASKTIDAARPAYGRSRVDRPRRCIFVATTNEDTYLRDTTGNRRFWPVKLHGVIPGKLRMIDLAGIERDRDQLWAEAVAAEGRGEPLVIPENLWPAAAAEQQARMEDDPWFDTLASSLARRIQKFQEAETKGAKAAEEYAKNFDGKFAAGTDEKGEPEWRVGTDYLLTDVLDLPKERQHNTHTKRLADVMRSLGWHRTKTETPIRIGKTVKRGYLKAAKEEGR
jgi:predicted P-loop ATPase